MLGIGFKLGKHFKQQVEQQSNWILAANSWNDSGVWVDAETWND